jgi:hypothetical protein
MYVFWHTQVDGAPAQLSGSIEIGDILLKVCLCVWLCECVGVWYHRQTDRQKDG